MCVSYTGSKVAKLLLVTPIVRKMCILRNFRTGAVNCWQLNTKTRTIDGDRRGESGGGAGREKFRVKVIEEFKVVRHTCGE